PRVSQDEAQFSESLDGDRVDNAPFAGEVAVEDRLAVVDPVAQPAGGDGVPPLGFRHLAGGRDDGLAPVGPVALTALGNGHGSHYSAARWNRGAKLSLLVLLASIGPEGASP